MRSGPPAGDDPKPAAAAAAPAAGAATAAQPAAAVGGAAGGAAPADPFGLLGSLGGQGGLGGLGGMGGMGAGGMSPEQLMADPAMMRQMMDSPAMQVRRERMAAPFALAVVGVIPGSMSSHDLMLTACH